MARLAELPGLSVGFIPVNPRLPGPFAVLQRLKYVRTAVTSVAYAIALLRRVRHYDVIHAFSASYLSYLIAPVPAMIVGRLFGRTVLLNYHSGHAADHFTRWPTAIPLARLAHVIVVPSEYLANVFRDYGLDATVVFNFIDQDAFAFKARTAFEPLYLSNRNFEPGYNVSCTLRAFARIQARVPNARLLVAGSGSQDAMLRDLATTLQLRHVEWLGRVEPDRMPALYDRADFYLNSPDVDNMPLSVLEAHMAGLPVISTNAGGIPFIVEHGATGWLVPVDDDAALARGALALLEDQRLAATMAACARRTCEDRYTWSAVGPQWMRVYTQAAGASTDQTSESRSVSATNAFAGAHDPDGAS
jgi:glycosyltransferase involved in cell wall biosynthesis